MMLPIAAAALLLGVLAPFIHARVWGVPVGQLSVRMALRSVLVTSIGVVLLGTVSEGCLKGFLPELGGIETSGVAAALLSGATMLGILWLGVGRSGKLRGAVLLALRLREPGARAEARAALEELLARLRDAKGESAGRRYANIVLIIVAPITEAGLWDWVEALLTDLPVTAMTPSQRALRAQGLSTCRLREGDIEGTQKALAEVPRPVDEPRVEAWLSTTEALVLAVTGQGEEALRRLGEEDGASDESLKQSQRIVRAHAFASRGDSARAQALLEQVCREVGPQALDRAIDPPGPASELARRVRGI